MALIREEDEEILDWYGMNYPLPWLPEDWTLGSFVRMHGEFYYAMYGTDLYGWATVINQRTGTYRIEEVHFDNLSMNDKCSNGRALIYCFRLLCKLRKTHGVQAFTFTPWPGSHDLERFLRSIGARRSGLTWFLRL
jgi:hypothetical protein